MKRNNCSTGKEEDIKRVHLYSRWKKNVTDVQLRERRGKRGR